MPNIKSKHLIFKANIAGIKTYLLVINGSESELIDKSFVRINKISTFKLKQTIRLKLKNKKIVEWLDRGCLIEVEIGNHQE